jgi:hypothetical protein
MNRLEDYANVFEGITPFSGEVPPGYAVDSLGILTDLQFIGQPPTGSKGGHITTVPLTFPVGGNGEGWFEQTNWLEAARAAREHYVMITLGACYGAQAVGAVRALQLVNPMPYKVVAVEPIPEQCDWVARHMRDNGINPDDQWLVQFAISDRNAPVLFPVGASGSGAQNCFSTNESEARKSYVKLLTSGGRAEEALRNLLLKNSTGITKDLVPGYNFKAEIQFVSAITLSDVLSPFQMVDYLESDIQQSEILVFPPFMDMLKRKVRRIHIGTHGKDVHWTLHKLFEKNGWEMLFSYEPNSIHQSALGQFITNDGILTVRNPHL